MALTEITDKYIKPLTKLEKLQLIADITRMLQEEEAHAAKFFKKDVTYPILTPNISSDESAMESAFQLQQLLTTHTP